MSNLPVPTKNFQGLPAVMSFFIPGLGQLYKGQILPFLFFLVVTPMAYWMLWFPGAALHLYCILHAGSSRR